MPTSIDDARERLRERLATVPPEQATVGALLEVGRDIHGEVPPDQEREGGMAHLSFETFGRTNAHVSVELVWRWAHSDNDESPERLFLRFDAAAKPDTREVSVRAADYPHSAAFVTAALEAAELDPSAPVTNVKLEVEHA